MLVKFGASVNAVDVDGYSGAHIAAEFGHLDSLKELRYLHVFHATSIIAIPLTVVVLGRNSI